MPNPALITAGKYITAGLPGAVLVTATSSDGLDWLDGLTPLQGLGSGAVIVVLGLLLYRVILRAFNRADEVQQSIIEELRDENSRLIAEAVRARAELETERKLRLSLESKGIVDRRNRNRD